LTETKTEKYFVRKHILAKWDSGVGTQDKGEQEMYRIRQHRRGGGWGEQNFSGDGEREIQKKNSQQ